MKYQRSSHATYDVRYHVVWITKYRNPVLTDEMQKRLDFLIHKIGEKI
jgi:putative transposase